MTLITVKPIVNSTNEFFWDGAKKGQVLVQQCSMCSKKRHPPALTCPQCRSSSWDAVQCSPVAEIYSFTQVEHPSIPTFPKPYYVVLVEFPESIRMVGLLLENEIAGLKIGDKVKSVFIDIEGGLSLPVFKLVKKEH